MSLLLKGLHIASRQLVILAGVLAALALLLVGSGAWLSAAVAERQDEIAHWAGERTGYQIEIGEAGLYWLDFVPKLMLADVNVLTRDSKRPVVTFDTLYLGVDLLKSIEQQQAVIDNASINGLRVGILRDKVGQFSVRDLSWKPDAKTSANKQWQVLLTGLKKLRLQNIEIIYQDAYQPRLSGHYQVHQGSLSQSGKWLAADINLALPQHLGQQLMVSGEVLHEGNDFPKWDVTLEASQLQLADLLNEQQYRGVGINQGRGDLRINVSKQANQINANGLMRLQSTRFYRPMEVTANMPSPFMVDYLNTEFNLMLQGQRWRLDLPSLDMVVNGESWPENQLWAEFDPETGTHLQTNYLRLSDISDIAALIDDAPAWLRTYAPAGDAKFLQLSVDKNKQIQQFQVSIDELGFQENGDIPGASGLSFMLNWSGEQVDARFHSRDLALYAQNWLPKPLYFDSLNGHISWPLAAQAGQISIDELQLVNEDINVRLNGSVERAETSQVDLTLALEDFNIANWLAYVPEQFLKPKFIKWAQNAFVAGRINQGAIQLQGNPSAFPFNQQPDVGIFSMRLPVNGVELHYGDAWPNLEAVNGLLTSSGNDLHITTDSGRIFDFEFAGVDATISNLVSGLPALSLEGVIEGKAQQGLGFLQNSPLKNRFGPIADWLSIDGATRIKLNLAVPLLKASQTKVSGEIDFKDNRLLMSGLKAMPVEQIEGQIKFNNNGLQSEQLVAKILGEPASISIKPQAYKTRIQINSGFNISRLASNWQLDLPTGIVGHSDLTANIDVAETEPGDFTVEIGLNSDLRGINFDLPAPFNKLPANALPLKVKLLPEAALRIDLQLADWFSAVAEVADRKLRAGVALGGQTPSLPSAGISVTGRMDTLSISDWQEWWQQNRIADTDDKWQVDSADLHFNHLMWHALILTDVSVNMQRQPTDWLTALDAVQLKGIINWPLAGDSLPTLDFSFVDLPLSGDMIKNRVSHKRSVLWPGFQLNIDRLVLDDMKLGRLQVRALRDASSWQLLSASLQSPTLQATASGEWRQMGEGDNTQLNLQLNSEDLANLLVDLGYQPAISARQVNVEGTFTWPDAPINFNIRDFQGQMQLDVGTGELKDVEPGTAGRIFGLLSVTALPRRLSLDFSDLFGSGFGFSRITGRFDFAKGMATTNDLQMRADSALVSVTGPINLLERTYNQIVQITPSVSTTLPLAGAVAGGPIGLGVGTAIFIVDKLASRLFDRNLVDIITYRYQLTGPWDTPEMKLQTAEQP